MTEHELLKAWLAATRDRTDLERAHLLGVCEVVLLAMDTAKAEAVASLPAADIAVMGDTPYRLLEDGWYRCGVTAAEPLDDADVAGLHRLVQVGGR